MYCVCQGVGVADLVIVLRKEKGSDDKNRRWGVARI